MSECPSQCCCTPTATMNDPEVRVCACVCASHYEWPAGGHWHMTLHHPGSPCCWLAAPALISDGLPAFYQHNETLTRVPQEDFKEENYRDWRGKGETFGSKPFAGWRISCPYKDAGRKGEDCVVVLIG